ncbi:MAG: tRNA pseudouridine(38-40) synthase TruA [Parachlamydiales bacterium]
MINLKGIVAYDGTAYLGWQEVGMGPTIEGTLQAVLEQILQHPVSLQAASRTDAGVHATGQTIQFFSRKGVPPLRSVNALLPPDVRVLSLEEAPANFHPTLDALAKEYRYQLTLSEVQLPHARRTHWHCPHLDVAAMEEAADRLRGRHDFAAFANVTKEGRENTVRTLHLTFEGELTVVLRAESFLYRMARNVVGTLVQVGQGKLPPNAMGDILAGLDRQAAGMCAPAHGLALVKVDYDRKK